MKKLNEFVIKGIWSVTKLCLRAYAMLEANAILWKQTFLEYLT